MARSAGADALGGDGELQPDEIENAMRMVFEGRPSDALAYLKMLEPTRGDDPLFLILRTRVHRDELPVDDERKDTISDLAEPLHRDLDRAIEICSRRIDAGDSEPKLYLYRGWAWMAKSHLRSFTRSFWKAGRDAGKGKNDLEHYLTMRPDDPTAHGALGAFFYFADAIPQAFKFLSKLLFLPTGDRERGLMHLERAAQSDRLADMDFRLLLYTVYFLFEGRYEDGVNGMMTVATRFPHYTRLTVPFALMKPFVPGRQAQFDRIVENAIAGVEGRAERDVNWNTHSLLRYLQGASDRYFRSPADAEARLRAVIEEAPAHPDWTVSFARFELGRLYATQGRTEDARAVFRAVEDDDATDYMDDEADEMMDALGDPLPPGALPSPAWIESLYDADPRERTPVTVPGGTDVSLHMAFYLGERELLAGRLDSAREWYAKVVDREAAPWNEGYQMLAASRLAEIHGARGDFERSVSYLDTALDFYHREFLVDWILEGRKRYYERLAAGDETVLPSLYSDAR